LGPGLRRYFGRRLRGRGLSDDSWIAVPAGARLDCRPFIQETGCRVRRRGQAEGLNLTLRQVPCWIYGG
jgi:hypothetical protein